MKTIRALIAALACFACEAEKSGMDWVKGATPPADVEPVTSALYDPCANWPQNEAEFREFDVLRMTVNAQVASRLKQDYVAFSLNQWLTYYERDVLTMTITQVAGGGAVDYMERRRVPEPTLGHHGVVR